MLAKRKPTPVAGIKEGLRAHWQEFNVFNWNYPECDGLRKLVLSIDLSQGVGQSTSFLDAEWKTSNPSTAGNMIFSKLRPPRGAAQFGN